MSKNWVHNGCSDDEAPEGSFQDNSYIAGVRCCSDGLEKLFCETPGNGSATYMDLNDAFNKCDELGLRLCTKDELMTDECVMTDICPCDDGGNCHGFKIWTLPPSPGKEELYLNMMISFLQ